MIRYKLKGFSLFEMIIVLFIISMVAGAVTILVNASSSPEKRLNQVGSQLFAEMNFAIDEALMQRRLIGLRIESDKEGAQYSWHVYSNARWALLSEPLSEVVIPDEMQLDISVEDELLESLLEQSLSNIGEEEQAVPAIIFYPNSDISEFELSVALRKNDNDVSAFRIYIDERGQLTNSFIEGVIAAKSDQ
jgi:type II secretion system protein H